jgi:hypothetical protein
MMRKEVTVTSMIAGSTGGTEENHGQIQAKICKGYLNMDTSNKTKQAYQILNNYIRFLC